MPLRPKPAPPTVVLLVRHGLTPTTGKELPEAGPGPQLTAEGRRQAEQAGDHIAEWRPHLPAIGHVFTSPLVRARETAAIVAAALGLPLTEDPGLVDCDTGEWAGAELKQLARKAEWGTVVRYPSGFAFPGGEPLAAMQARVVGRVRDLVSAHRGQTVVVVSHADPIKAVLADALGMHLDLFQRISVYPASVSAVSYGAHGPSLLQANWSAVPSAPGRPKRRGTTR